MPISMKAELAFLRLHEKELNEIQQARLAHLTDIEAEQKTKDANAASTPVPAAIKLSPEVQQMLNNQQKMLDELTDNQEAKPDQPDSDANVALMKKLNENDVVIKGLQAKISGGKVTPIADKGIGNQMISKQLILHKLSRVPSKNDHETKLIHRYNDEMYVAMKVFAHINKVPDTVAAMAVKNFAHFKTWSEMSDHPYIKGMGAGETNAGAEWIPNTMSPDFIDLIRLDAPVARQFQTFDQPDDPYLWPILTSGTTMYYLPEQVDDDAEVTEASKVPASTLGTDKRYMYARKIMARTVISSELNEDSIVAVIPLIFETMHKDGKEQLDNAIINGDRSTPHMDSDVTSSTDVRKAYVGLRKDAAALGVDISTFTYENCVGIRSQLGIMSVNPADLFWLSGIKGSLPMTYIKDSSGNNVYVTVDKAAAMATNMKGELPFFNGSAHIISEFMREDLNALGYYDATVDTNGQLLCVYVPGYVLGNYKDMTIKTQEIIDTDQIKIVARFRKSFFHKRSAAATARGYGLGLP